MQTRLADFIRRHPRRARRGRHPAQVRALRLLHRDLSHLPASGRRARRTARAHLSRQAAPGRRGGYRPHPDPPRPLPHLPRLRDHVSVRRALRAARGHRTPPRGRAGRAPARRAPEAQGAARGPPAPLPVRAAARRWAASRARCCRAPSRARFRRASRRGAGRRLDTRGGCSPSAAACRAQSRPASTRRRRGSSTGWASATCRRRPPAAAGRRATTSALATRRSR